MSEGRSGYIDDYDGDYANIYHINWRGAVNSALRGKRGQKFLQELLESLDSVPIKRLVKHELAVDEKFMMSVSHWGMYEHECESYCALGAIGKTRGMPIRSIDVDDYDSIGNHFGIANAMAREIEYVNDEGGKFKETPEDRFERVRSWVAGKLRSPGYKKEG